MVCAAVGAEVGTLVGVEVGTLVGVEVGTLVGVEVETLVGVEVETLVGVMGGTGELVGDALLVGVAEGATVLVGWGGRIPVEEGEGEGDLFFAGAETGSIVFKGTIEGNAVCDNVGSTEVGDNTGWSF
jgi:hypothetical protein